MKKLFLFDVDGTLVKTKSGDEFRKTPDDWELLPGRKEYITKLLKDGFEVALITNQGGAAFGYFELVEMHQQIADLASQLGDIAFYIDYTHPKGFVSGLGRNSWRRKPGPGMVYEAILSACVNPDETVFIGDRPEDQEAAENAKIDFIWSDEFFRFFVCCSDKYVLEEYFGLE
jgi:D-glycero-D-manno-heptose 1,7-bisphosphate phosphatase